MRPSTFELCAYLHGLSGIPLPRVNLHEATVSGTSRVKLLTQYDWKEVCAPSQSQVNVGTSARLSSQDGVSHQEETATFSLPQFNRLFEASFVREESSASNADVAVIPSQHRVTQQILSHW
jgi:hypothetical protein